MKEIPVKQTAISYADLTLLSNLNLEIPSLTSDNKTSTTPQLTKTKDKKLYQYQHRAPQQQLHQNRMTYYMSYAAQSQLEPVLLSKPKLGEIHIRSM